MSCIQVRLSPKKHFPKYVKSELEEYFQCRFIQNCLLTSVSGICFEIVYLQVPHCVVPDPLADAIMLLEQLGK